MSEGAERALLNPTTTEPTDTFLDRRHEGRMEGVPGLYRTAHERLACELALHMDDPEAVFARYHYTVEEAATLVESPAFIALLERITVEVRESGLSFKMKARAQAEELLASSYEMATDPATSAAVRADLIKWTARMAGHEPKEKEEVGKGGGLTLSITFSGQEPKAIVSGREPVTINQEG